MYKGARESMEAAMELQATLNHETVPALFGCIREFVSSLTKVECIYTAGMAPDGVYPEMWLQPDRDDLKFVVNERFAQINTLENGEAVSGTTILRESYDMEGEYASAIQSAIRTVI